MCNCDAIELFADGIINQAREYNDTEEYNISVPNDKGHEYWENIIFDQEKGQYKFETFRERLLAVDLHSPEFGSFWPSFSKLKRNTNIYFKELLGTYQFHNCSKSLFGEVTPVYKKVLQDGTEAYMYKARIGGNWQVTKLLTLRCWLFRQI